MSDEAEILAFMRRYNFATVITAKHDRPMATHLPFVVLERENNLVLASHFALSNPHHQYITDRPVMVIFSEPHAYISPQHYDKTLNVPTWNYMAVHVCGKARIISDYDRIITLLEASIDFFEADYRAQWQTLPDDYKMKMVRGIVAFEIEATEIQAKKKLSQNKTKEEQQRIIKALLDTNNDSSAMAIAEYMQQNLLSNED